MTRILALEREVARAWGPDVESPGITEQLHGETRQLLAVPDARALLEARDVTAVGFFGSCARTWTTRRSSSTSAPSRRRSPGSHRSGSSATSTSGRSTAATATSSCSAPRRCRTPGTGRAAHRRAVAIAPAHYHHIRLHKGRIPGPLMGDGAIEVQRTQYLDFEGLRMWRGLRVYGESAT